MTSLPKAAFSEYGKVEAVKLGEVPRLIAGRKPSSTTAHGQHFPSKLCTTLARNEGTTWRDLLGYVFGSVLVLAHPHSSCRQRHKPVICEGEDCRTLPPVLSIQIDSKTQTWCHSRTKTPQVE
eukprot:1811796-Amphidinium_carterae.1